MKKHTLLPLLVLSALFTGAGKYKISKVGQPDVYVPTLDSDAKTLTVESVAGPGTVPIGGMVAVMPNIDVSNAWQPPASGAIKDGFMRADGTTIAASHRNAGCKLAVGTKLPNMVNSYPRGNTTSTNGTTGMGGANTVTLAAANIPQVSTSYTPAGTNAASGVSGSVGGSDGNHGHSLTLPVGGKDGSPNNPGDYYNTQYTNNPTQTTAWTGNFGGVGGAGVHGHGFSLTAAAQGFTGTAATITVGTASGSLQAVNNEPAYVETVWVIRVK